MEKEKLVRAVNDQWEMFHQIDGGINRNLLEELEGKIELEHVIDIAGLRRVGKTTLLRQLAGSCFEAEEYYAINFDDDRLIEVKAGDFQLIYEVLLEEFGERRVFFLDEVQNVAGWERFVRRLMDGGFKVILTGSNSQLLDRELGSKLTGRHLSHHLFPFSFDEFLRFKEETVWQPGQRLTSERTVHYLKLFKQFLQYGGMPLYWKYENRELLKSVYEDVIFRDVVARHGVSKVDALKRLSYFLVSNVGGLFSPGKLKQPVGVESGDTLRHYVQHLKEAWLLFTVPVFSTSVKKQQVNPKKIYCIDNGIVENVAFKFTETRGNYLENAVFIELKRRNYEIYYYKTESGREVDFLLRKENEGQRLIQVCWDLSGRETRRREVEALLEAAAELGGDKCQIITMREEETLTKSGLHIEIIPAWKWFLGDVG